MRNTRDRLGTIDPRDRALLQLLIEPRGLAGFFEAGQPRFDLRKEIGLNDGLERSMLAIVARGSRRAAGEAHCCGAEERFHRIGLPTPRMRDLQTHPIAA